ncbi:hypothetical protein EIN_032080 [Entamoeba invadens IP1]|uniref:Uncharacterized protein n=1 Tax=Entamoeba invadens IP1 TaxID=370355 RepID=A0A0A1TY62_ENTIV|nr:hypothetical protein EIN_032080 [Entamoeba invadens IP1]ELP86457.1 hypothetical protein EIN_032080 [Entamoeba invadens IP1]|eukprot:XP_004185803.1 hypothetical protein EIN_032080 [Entamoeba invadens IP1]
MYKRVLESLKNRMAIPKQKVTSSEAKRISVSYEAEQETVLMALLLKVGVESFTLMCPRKRSDNSQFLDILGISILGQQLNFQDYIEHLILASGKSIAKTSKNGVKYDKRNHNAATNNTLVALLEKAGFNIVFKNTKDSNVTLKMNRVNVISFGNLVLSWDVITSVGSKMNMKIKQIAQGSKKEENFVLTLATLDIADFIEQCTFTAHIDQKVLLEYINPMACSAQIEGNYTDTVTPFNTAVFNQSEVSSKVPKTILNEAKEEELPPVPLDDEVQQIEQFQQMVPAIFVDPISGLYYYYSCQPNLFVEGQNVIQQTENNEETFFTNA